MKDIVQKNAKVLRQKALEIPMKEISSVKIQKIITDMKEALAPHKDGVAIAATQIGVPLRIFVVSGHVFDPDALADDDKESPKHSDMVFINPKATKISRKKIPMNEGCLSVRDIYGDVVRADKVTVNAYDENGKRFTRGASGLLSQIFQHEIDHLDGILFIDKAKDLKRLVHERS